MSITITIANNREHARQHGNVRTETFDCEMCERKSNDCPFCQGTGKVTFERLDHELNLANGNFSTLWNSLGLDVEPFGEIDGRTLANAVETLDPSLAVRSPSVEYRNERPFVYGGGIDHEQVNRYIGSLLAIAREAERREELVIWG